MAICYLVLQSVNRAKGRSAVASAAYRHSDRMTDQRTGQEHDYTRKEGVLHGEIVLPEGAPEWASDRARLWNEAEAAEVRRNATVAREIVVALPDEISAEARRDLTHAFAREIAQRHQVAVDYVIHAPGREGDERNHHAHVMFTSRRMTPDGLGEKTRELDVKATSHKAVEHMRERWASLQNAALERAQVDQRVDHRSYARQGQGRMASVHLGPAVTAVERGAQRQAREGRRAYAPVTELGRKNALAGQRNGALEQLRHMRSQIERRIEAIAERAVKIAKRVERWVEQRLAREQAPRSLAERVAAAERGSSAPPGRSLADRLKGLEFGGSSMTDSQVAATMAKLDQSAQQRTTPVKQPEQTKTQAAPEIAKQITRGPSMSR